MKRFFWVGLVFLFWGLVSASTPSSSPFALDGRWQAAVQSAIAHQETTRNGSEHGRDETIEDWMLERLWAGNGAWMTLLDESIRDLEFRQAILRASRRSLDKQVNRRKALLADLTVAMERQESMGDLAVRMQRLQPVFPDSSQLSVSVVRAPEEPSSTSAARTAIAPDRPAAYTKSLDATVVQLKTELGILSSRMTTTTDQIELLESAAQNDFAVIREFLDRHYTVAVEINRQKKERLRLATEASKSN